MFRNAFTLAFLAGLLLTGSALASSGPSDYAALPITSGVPSFTHIAIVVMENHSESAIMGNPAAPYINSLASNYTYLDNYHAVSHPSLPNYLALTGGDTYGITSDCTRCYVPARNVADLLPAAGISGTAYMESMPQACFSGSSGEYAQKHNPFIYFDDVRTNPGRCSAVVPFTQLANDVANNQLPAYMWITPDSCSDMHDCSVATGDRWLANNLGPLLSSPAFTQQNSLLALVWDEDDGSGDNRVPLILVGPHVKRGYVSHTPANHYSLLRTIEAAWNLPALTANDGNAQPITDAFSS
ncbi:MAG TPA: alkaline phosphatase family protein [Chloroflexota bacterium]|nr:alkaline phosphatase family protein [Chloroflexota bacterium]